MRHPDEAVEELLAYIEQTVPYVQATINPGNTFPSKERPGWVEIHDGRAHSSERQLEGIMEKVRRIRVGCGDRAQT